jgi:hypothetical protein
MKLFIMQFGSACYFIPRFIYYPQFPVLRHRQSVLFAQGEGPRLKPTQNKGKITLFYL